MQGKGGEVTESVREDGEKMEAQGDVQSFMPIAGDHTSASNEI